MDTVISGLTDPLPSWILAFHSVSILLFLCLLVLLISLLFLVNCLKIVIFSLNNDFSTKPKEITDISYSKMADLKKEPNQLLATFLVTNFFLIVSIIISLFSFFNLLFPDPGIFQIFFLLVSVVISITLFGETLPFFRETLVFNNRHLAFIRFLVFLCRPFTAIIIQMDILIEKLVEKREKQAVLDEINEILEEPENEEEKEILKGIFSFSAISVKQIMKPRLDMTAYPYNLSFHELLDKINKYAYSRIPVYGESLDKIEGILYIKDLLPHINKNDTYKWQRLLKKPYFVPENKKIEELLKDFQESRVHIAIVVNEYGGTSGLITLEDILEEIVGEIQDEFDDEETSYKKQDENTFIFEAKISLHEFCKIIDAKEEIFEKAKGESESLAGLVLELFGKFPKTGEFVEFENFKFSVLSSDIKKIRKIKLEVLDKTKSETN